MDAVEANQATAGVHHLQIPGTSFEVDGRPASPASVQFELFCAAMSPMRMAVSALAFGVMVSAIEASSTAKPASPAVKCPLLSEAAGLRYGDQSDDGLKAACDRGDLDACIFLGLRSVQPMVAVNGQASPHALATALAVFDKACAGGRGNACSNLSGMHKSGWGVAPNESAAEALQDKACALFEKGCAARCAEDCALLAYRCVNRSKTKRTPEIDGRVADLTARACDYGDAGSCDAAARYYGNLGGDSSVPRADLKRAIVLLTKGCDGGRSKACDSLGRVYERGVGGLHNPEKSAIAYGKACDAVATCSAPHLDTILKMSCQRDVAEGCCGLGRVVEATRGAAAAAEFFKRAVDAGGARSCPDARRPAGAN